MLIIANKESVTKSFVLLVYGATMDAIEARVTDEFRYVNGQIQWILAEALRKSGRMKKPKPKPIDPPEEASS